MAMPQLHTSMKDRADYLCWRIRETFPQRFIQNEAERPRYDDANAALNELRELAIHADPMQAIDFEKALGRSTVHQLWAKFRRVAFGWSPDGVPWGFIGDLTEALIHRPIGKTRDAQFTLHVRTLQELQGREIADLIGKLRQDYPDLGELVIVETDRFDIQGELPCLETQNGVVCGLDQIKYFIFCERRLRAVEVAASTGDDGFSVGTN